MTKQVYKNRRYIDVIDQIIDNLSNRISFELKKKSIDRQSTHMKLLGCNKQQLKQHLELLFDSNMSWENYGEWEIDHIKPICSFNMADEGELSKCCNYNNLQPLWKTDNRSKGGKIE